MAGFLGLGNYAKPGPGVGKDEPQKHSFFLFFELYFRKFWKLIQINMLFFVFCIPFFIPLILTGVFQPKNSLLFYLSLIPLVGISVIIPGLMFILRNYARQENAFLWMDFTDTIKNNWKQALSVGVIDFIVYFVMIFSLTFYQNQISVNYLFLLPFALCIVFVTIFTFMQYYLFIMLITFDLKMKQLLKNAIIFSFAGLGHNILITLFCGILALAAYIIFPISLFLVPFILISTSGFIVAFNVWPTIKKFMIPDESTDVAVLDNTSDQNIFEDKGKG